MGFKHASLFSWQRCAVVSERWDVRAKETREAEGRDKKSREGDDAKRRMRRKGDKTWEKLESVMEAATGKNSPRRKLEKMERGKK